MREDGPGGGKKMRSWNDLGTTETIYEEQEDGSELSSPSPSPASSSASCTHSSPSLLASLQQTVEEWSRTTGSKPDLLVHVYDRRFHLHKDLLVSHSRYLRRQVVESSSVVDLSPPLTIMPETFAAVASFCYGSDISITPDNVAALRIATEWLDMTSSDNPNHGGYGSLLERAEWYFCQTVASSAAHALVVLRTCLALLLDAAESAAFLAGRCIEALSVAGVGETETRNPDWFDDLSTLTAEEFQMIADAIQDRLEHDFVYNIVDHYLEKQSEENNLTDEEKNRICSIVNCEKLSPSKVIHLVRNPRMPLRFVVQAMLMEQLHTRVSFYDRVCKTHGASTPVVMGTVTLGDILQRDAALRQAQHLRSTMEATYLRIQMLERELLGMRRRLREEGKRESEEKKESLRVRSESCRFFEETGEEEEERVVVEMGRGSKSGRWFGRRLVKGVRSVLTAMRSESRSTSCSGAGDVVAASASASQESNKRARHRRNRSFS